MGVYGPLHEPIKVKLDIAEEKRAAGCFTSKPNGLMNLENCNFTASTP